MTVAIFIVAAAVSLLASALLVTRLERLGERLHAPEAMLGLVTALAADAPEVSAAVTAVARGQHDVGAGVVLGSNVFNLAALLGLSAIVAGWIALHRRVVLLEGFVAICVAATAVAAVAGWLAPAACLALALLVLAPYVVLSGLTPTRRRRLPLPNRWRDWLASAVNEEELELLAAIRPKPGGWKDALLAAAALVVVVAASAVMEATAVTLGERWGVSEIVVGGVVLAAVTSLPNAAAAVYLARKGRASATLSEALNSNALNVVVGLFVPAIVAGVALTSSHALTVAAWYGGLTILALGLAYTARGLGRWAGAVIVAAYAVFVVTLAVG
jgi:cation:H+ antiporter